VYGELLRRRRRDERFERQASVGGGSGTAQRGTSVEAVPLPATRFEINYSILSVIFSALAPATLGAFDRSLDALDRPFALDPADDGRTPGFDPIVPPRHREYVPCRLGSASTTTLTADRPLS
jgi:hypothetical protein